MGEESESEWSPIAAVAAAAAAAALDLGRAGSDQTIGEAGKRRNLGRGWWNVRFGGDDGAWVQSRLRGAKLQRRQRDGELTRGSYVAVAASAVVICHLDGLLSDGGSASKVPHVGARLRAPCGARFRSRLVSFVLVDPKGQDTEVEE